MSNLSLALLSGEIAMVITPDRFALNNYVKQGVLTSLDEVTPELFERIVVSLRGTAFPSTGLRPTGIYPDS